MKSIVQNALKRKGLHQSGTTEEGRGPRGPVGWRRTEGNLQPFLRDAGAFKPVFDHGMETDGGGFPDNRDLSDNASLHVSSRRNQNKT